MGRNTWAHGRVWRSKSVARSFRFRSKTRSNFCWRRFCVSEVYCYLSYDERYFYCLRNAIFAILQSSRSNIAFCVNIAFWNNRCTTKLLRDDDGFVKFVLQPTSLVLDFCSDFFLLSIFMKIFILHSFIVSYDKSINVCLYLVQYEIYFARHFIFVIICICATHSCK